MRFRPCLGLFAFLVSMSCSLPSAGREREDEAPLVVLVEGGRGLEQRIHAAVAAELSAALEADVAHRVEVVVGAERVTVRYVGLTGSVERDLDRPTDDEALVETVALLAGNLARDQVGSLLDALTPAAGPAIATPKPRSFTPESPLAPGVLDAEVDVEPAPVALGAPPSAEHTDVGGRKPIFSYAQLSLVWPVAIFPDGQDRSFAVDVSALFGRSGGLLGLGIHGLGAVAHGDQRGANVSGLFTYRSGDLRGVSVGGLVDVGMGLEGLQISGVLGIAREARGAQVAGLVNLGEDVEGAQMATALNVTRRLRGLQLAGITNVAEGGRGAQIAVGTNHIDDLHGLQLSSGLNTAADVEGAQIGLINVAHRVSGVQVGLVNVAVENEGTAIGLLNVAGNGELKVTTWASTSSLTNLGLQMRVGPIFVIPSLGYHPLGAQLLRPRFALGGHIPIEPVFLQLVQDYSFAYPLETPEDGAEREGHHETSSTIRVGYQVTDMFGFFVGAGAHMDVTQTVKQKGVALRPELLGGLLLF